VFRSEIFGENIPVALSLLFGKIYTIMNKLGSKDLSRPLQTNCTISFFYLHLMLHACVQRFDVMDGKGNILGSERGLSVFLRRVNNRGEIWGRGRTARANLATATGRLATRSSSMAISGEFGGFACTNACLPLTSSDPASLQLV
jgi:hypothetical protein